MEFNFINLLGLGIVTIMLIPNIWYAFRFQNSKNKCENKGMNILEQIGRYACIILMFLPVGMNEFGFSSVFLLLVYVFGNGVLLVVYLIIWLFYFKKQTLHKAMYLALVPACIFLISGLTLCHWLLVLSSILFEIGHLYITYQNNN